jgi:hypothetical protein
MADKDTKDTKGTNVDPDKVDLSDAPQAKAARDAGLKHTAGGATTRDAMDAGVPMTPGEADEPIGPEDAGGLTPTRGDYSDRIDRGPHMVTIDRGPHVDTDAGEPRYVLVEQGAAPNADGVADVEPSAKGGVPAKQ